MTPDTLHTRHAAEPPIEFDARGARLHIASGHLAGWGGTAPDGRTLAANNYHLTLDGEPFPIVSGEFIPQRYPQAEWKDALLALRDGGCNVVSSYVFWGLIEPRADEFDFTGPNDIRRVAELCAELGLLFAPRIGPFNNSEYLLGGLPPWLYGMPLVERSNDPRYLERVRSYFQQVAAQFDGLFFSDGGPIVIVQLENELAHAPNDWRTLFGYTATDHRGPTGDDFAAHMSALHALALGAGIRPPFFAMTAWGLPGDLPDGAFLPTYGAYLDLHPHWDENTALTTFQSNELPYRGRYPSAFCELGTGSPARAAYRSRTPAEAMLVPALTRIGSSESIFVGYYLFHGGTNPVRGDGFGWTTKEPAFPLRSYDFWAPVSEFGERRRSFHHALPFNRFVREFGAELAALQVVEPRDPVLDPEEDRLRASLRADARSGFVFLADYGNAHPLSDRDDVHLTVELDERSAAFPRHSRLAVRSGRTAILPVGLDLGLGVTLAFATAQPLARLGSAEHPLLVFHTATGAKAEFAFEGVAASAISVLESSVSGSSAPTTATGDDTFDDPGGPSVVITVDAARVIRVAAGSGTVTIVVIPTEQAEHSAIVPTDAGRRLVTSDAELQWVGDELLLTRRRALGADGDEPVVLRRPGAGAAAGSTGNTGHAADDLHLALPRPTIDPSAIQVERIGDARITLTVPDTSVDVTDLWLDLTFTGDLVRVFDARTGILVADQFGNGAPWRLKVGRFSAALHGAGLQFRVEPVSSLVEVANDEGILLDHAEQAEGGASVDDLAFSQLVSVAVALRELA